MEFSSVAQDSPDWPRINAILQPQLLSAGTTGVCIISPSLALSAISDGTANTAKSLCQSLYCLFHCQHPGNPTFVSLHSLVGNFIPLRIFEQPCCYDFLFELSKSTHLILSECG